MSSPRVQKIFQAMPDQLKKLGPYTFDMGEVLRWAGRDSDAHDACVIDADSATWATGNRRVILVAYPASDKNNTAALKTQSHATGHTLDGGVKFKVYAEAPASHTGEHAKWLRIVMHHLLGQLGAPMELLLTANGTEPTVIGVNGATSTATFTSAGSYQPWGMAYPGGI